MNAQAEMALSALTLRALGRKYPGSSVVVEGVSMAGKTTLIKGLYETEVMNPEEWTYYREPGSTNFAALVRELVQGLDKEHLQLSGLTSLMLYSAARRDLHEKHVLADLNEGKKLLLDRSWLSGALQIADGVPMWYVVLTGMIMTGGLIPSAVLCLDLDPAEAQKRKVGKGDLDLFDMRPESYHRMVREAYRNLGLLYRGMSAWHTIDASQAPGVMLKQATEVLRTKGLV